MASKSVSTVFVHIISCAEKQQQRMFLGNDTGNPWVRKAIPLPIPQNTAPVWWGVQFKPWFLQVNAWNPWVWWAPAANTLGGFWFIEYFYQWLIQRLPHQTKWQDHYVPMTQSRDMPKWTKRRGSCEWMGEYGGLEKTLTQRRWKLLGNISVLLSVLLLLQCILDLPGTLK